MQDVNVNVASNIVVDIENNLNDVRDLVEPAAAPRRFRESVVDPWLAVADFGPNPGPDPLDENSYSEWQLVGADNDDDDDDSSSLERVVSLLLKASTLASPSTTEDPAHEEDDGGGGSDDGTTSAIPRLLRFLFNGGRTTRIVWLSRSRFLTCDGPHSGPPADFWDYYWARHELPFYATVKAAAGPAGIAGAATEAAIPAEAAAAFTADDDRTYSFCLGGVPDDGPDRWPAVLASLLSRAPDARAVLCALRPGPDLARLEAVVAMEPPSPSPPRGGGGGGGSSGSSGSSRRTLVFGGDVTEEAARIIARRTHRETVLEVDGRAWGGSGVPVLAEALRENQCPKHLVVRGFAEVGGSVMDALWRAIGSTRAVEVLEVEIQSLESSRRLLEAIRDNVGLRKLVATHPCFATGEFMKEFWSAALTSRTLTTVDASQLTAHIFVPDGDPQECARHVVALLRTNRVVIDLRYDPRAHDAALMEAEAVPILQLNRLRRMAAAGDSNHRRLPVLLGSALVRRHPMMRYHLLRRNVDTLLLHLPKPSSSSSAEEPGNGPRRKRHRPSS
jgi:hypothetical protein